MAENVNTGGLKKFDYKGHTPKLKEEYRKEIDEAYEAYYERKKEEKRKKKIMWILLVLLLLILIGVALVVKIG